MVSKVISKDKIIGISVDYYFLIAFGGIFSIVALLIAADNNWFYYGFGQNIVIFLMFLIFGLSLIGSPTYLKLTGDRFIVVKIKVFFFRSLDVYPLKNYSVISVNKKSYFEPTKILYEKNTHKGFAVYLLANGSMPLLEVSHYRFFRGSTQELEKYINFAQEVSLLTGLPIEIQKNVT